MYAISFLIGVGILFSTSSSAFFLSSLSPEHKCYALIHKEIKTLNLTRSLGGIVGIGWNDITNEETLPVLSITYDKCQTVPDGDFLIPDNVIATPIKKANIETTTTTFESFKKFKDYNGGSFEVHGGGGFDGIGASGSLSVETKLGKEHMERQSRTGFTKKLEYHAFDLIADENKGFDESFTNRLKEVAEAIKGKNLLLAQYEAESIIGDYGSYVTNKALVGANVLILGFTSFTKETDKTDFTLKVSAEFDANIFGVAKFGTKDTEETKQTFKTGTTTSTSQTFYFTNGGADIKSLLDNPGNKVKVDSVVGLTRSGIPIYSLIHKGVLDGHYDAETIEIVQDLIYNATQEFYRHNTIPGCTDSTKQNYFYKANVEDGTCRNDPEVKLIGTVIHFLGTPIAEEKIMNIRMTPVMGGVIQECKYISSSTKIHKNLENGNQCDQFNHPNQLTKNISCPSGFEKKVAQSFYATFKDRVHMTKDDECNYTNCTKNHKIIDKVKITSYWCYKPVRYMEVSDKHKNYFYYSETTIHAPICGDFNNFNRDSVIYKKEGMIFGGIFENDNVFSDNRRCEIGFQEYPFFHNLKICLAPPNNFTAAKSVEFGGMISCRDPNQACPEGLSRYLATTINGCPYYYCASVAYRNSITTLPILKKPPYIDRDLAMSKTRYSYQHEIEEMEEKENESIEEVDVN